MENRYCHPPHQEQDFSHKRLRLKPNKRCWNQPGAILPKLAQSAHQCNAPRSFAQPDSRRCGKRDRQPENMLL